MGILTKTVQIRTIGKTLKYYRNLGYVCNHNDVITVNVKDLSPASGALVKVKCDMDGCTNINEIRYLAYVNNTRKNNGKYRCPTCGREASKDTVFKKYGYYNIGECPEIQNKVKKTTKERYGHECVFANEKIKKKIRETNQKKYGGNSCSCDPIIKAKQEKTLFEHYGVTVPSKSKEIQDRITKTMYQKYGVCCPIQNEEIKNKTFETNLMRYGVINPSLNQDVKNKIRKSLYKNQNVCTSTQQSYLYQLYGGKLNYPIQEFSADIVIDNLNIEYDGSGHQLGVKLGTYTQKEFNQRQIIRDNIVNREGYKIIRIISRKDLIPSDEILLQMLQDAKQYFKDYPEHSWINFDIDNEIVRNAENQDGVSYFYGELRRIKKDDL